MQPLSPNVVLSPDIVHHLRQMHVASKLQNIAPLGAGKRVSSEQWDVTVRLGKWTSLKKCIVHPLSVHYIYWNPALDFLRYHFM